jgi:hypothetical protein
MGIIKTTFELYTLNIGNLWDPVDDESFWEATIEIPDIYSLFDFHLFNQSTLNFGNRDKGVRSSFLTKMDRIQSIGLAEPLNSVDPKSWASDLIVGKYTNQEYSRGLTFYSYICTVCLYI